MRNERRTPGSERGARRPTRAQTRARRRAPTSTVLSAPEARQGETAAALRQAQSFAAEAAHELRTPLTTLAGELELLEEVHDPGAVARVRAQVSGLTGLVQRLLVLAQANRLPDAQREVVDLSDVASEALASLRDPTRVTTRIDDDVIVRGDQTLLRALLQDALENALKFSSGPVQLRIAQAGEACIEVDDEGPGIPAAERERVFQPFYRSPSARAGGRSQWPRHRPVADRARRLGARGQGGVRGPTARRRAARLPAVVAPGLSMLTHVDMLTRITVGALLGACVGYERSRHGRALGLRTHILVALASATFMVISSQFVFWQGYTEDDAGRLVQVDTSRIASTVVSGIGFLAGGAIMRAGGHVQNLTSAAGLWLVTATGMCAGAGMFVEAVSATGVALFALVVMRKAEDKTAFPIRGSLLVGRAHLGAVCRRLERTGMVVFGIEDDVHDKVVVRFELKKRVTEGLVPILQELHEEPGVESVAVKRST